MWEKGNGLVLKMAVQELTCKGLFFLLAGGEGSVIKVIKNESMSVDQGST